MKNIYIIILILLSCSLLHSCYTNRYVDRYVSLKNEFYNRYYGKTKDYIINNYPYPITNIRHLDNQYEILIFERAGNFVVSTRYAYFYMKNGVCYQIDTNEYTIYRSLERVSIFQ